jgi:hypothetical protein
MQRIQSALRREECNDFAFRPRDVRDLLFNLASRLAKMLPERRKPP